MCELQERKKEVTQSNVQVAMKEKGKVPMLRNREKMPSWTDTTYNGAADSQSTAELSITDLLFTAMVEWLVEQCWYQHAI